MDQNQESPAVEVLRPSQAPWLAIGGLIVVLAVIAGGAYYLSSATLNPEGAEERVEALETQGESTEPEAIEADLAAEDPDQFDEDFDAAFAELDASLAE